MILGYWEKMVPLLFYNNFAKFRPIIIILCWWTQKFTVDEAVVKLPIIKSVATLLKWSKFGKLRVCVTLIQRTSEVSLSVRQSGFAL